MAKITKVVRWDNRDTFALVYVEVGQEEAVVIVGGGVELYHSDKYDMTQAFVKKGVGARGEALPTPGNLTQLDDLEQILLNLVHEVSSIRAGKTFDPNHYISEPVAAIKSLMYSIVGEDEEQPAIRLTAEAAEALGKVTTAQTGRNELRAEQRARISKL